MPTENFGASGKRCRWATSSSGVRRVAWARRSRSGMGQASLLAEWVVALRYLQEERPLTLPKPSTGRDHTERFPPPHTPAHRSPPPAKKRVLVVYPDTLLTPWSSFKTWRRCALT